MPLYQFKCLKCGLEIEVMQKINDPSPICLTLDCQDSGPNDMKRQIGLSSFILKGNGWYKTDYKK